MPRDSGGTYTLPSGNPVVSGTVIESVWANDTMEDLAVQMNNVITRDGLLGPVQPFVIVDGTVALPGLAFALAPSTGLYRFSPNTVGMSIAGVLKQAWNSTGTGVVGDVDITGNTIIGGNLTVNGTIAGATGFDSDVTIEAADLGTLGFFVHNTSAAGTGSTAGFVASNDVANIAQLVMTSTTFTDYALAGPQAGLLYASGTGGLVLNATDASSTIRFAAGGGTEQMRLSALGNLAIGGVPTATERLTLQQATVPRIGLLKTSILTWYLGGDSTASNNFYFSANASKLMTITNGGDVGIGIEPLASVKLMVRVAANQNLAVATNGGTTTINAITDAGAGVGIRLAGQTIAFSGTSGALDHGFLVPSGNWGLGAGSSDAPWKVTVGTYSDTSNEVHVRNATAGLGLFTLDNQASGVLCLVNNYSGADFIGIPSGTAGLAANTSNMVFATGGSERMRINTGGAVGIGIIPSFFFHVATTAEAIAKFQTTATSGYLRFGSSVGETGYVGSGVSVMSGMAATDFGIVSAGGGLFLGALNAVKMRIDSSGKVGIGIAPTYLLDIENATQAVFRMKMTGGAEIYLQGNGVSDVRMGSLTSHPLLLSAAGNPRMTIRTGASVAITATMSGVEYNLGLDPGDTVGSIPIGGIVVGEAFGAAFVGGPLSTVVLSGASYISVYSFAGTTNITSGTFRLLGRTYVNNCAWIRVA